jgi:DNA polymerase IV
VSWKGEKTVAGSGFDTLDKALVVWQDAQWPTRDDDIAADPKAKNPNVHRRVDILVQPQFSLTMFDKT